MTDHLTTETQRPFEHHLAQLIVDALRLEMPADEIDPLQPLFGDGLGLDSIDALEIALVVSSNFGVELKSDDERNTKIFASLRSLADFVDRNRAR